MDILDADVFVELADLKGYAAQAAAGMARQGRGRSCAAESLRSSYARLRRCHRLIEQRYGSLASPPSACQWLLDNWHLAQRQYMACLPPLKQAKDLELCRGEPLILGLCRGLVASGQGRVDLERCREFLLGFGSVLPLTRQELELFPAALTASLLQGISRVCESMLPLADTLEQASLLSSLFGSLALLGDADMEELLEQVDITGMILSRDPSGDYSKMDRRSKSLYLHRLDKLSGKKGMAPQQLAEQLIATAEKEGRHIGHYLFKAPRPFWSWAYIAAQLLFPPALSLVLGFMLEAPGASVLLLFPVWQLFKGLLDQLLLHLIPPRPLPRLDMSRGIPPQGRSLCVISTLLGDDQAMELERLRLASRHEGKELLFGLLADLPSASEAVSPKDGPALRAAARQIRQLNERYGGGFYLFTRQRSFDGSAYSGKERKRGALLELAKLLRGQDSSLELWGDKEALRDIRYIITLDSDTRVYPGSLGQLVGAALHPLNRPVIDPKLKRVVSGYGLLHPRIATDLESSVATDHALIFAGPGGSDPYGALGSELYMDAFGNGGFAGKGIIDIDAFLTCAGDRLPQGRILSHDALEGAYLHGGYMGDVEFCDSFPEKPLAYYKRLDRWTRGDWQNAAWIFRRELSALDRFRLLDSLRRSLFAPMTLLAILWGFAAPESRLAVAAWAALLALLSKLLWVIADSSLQRRQRLRLRRHTRLLTGIGGAIVQCFMELWLLPYEAWVCFWAIATALWRMLVSRRKLLQWQVSAQAQRESGDLARHIRYMWPCVVLGVLLMAFSPTVIGKASGFMWLLSPAAAAALALPAVKEPQLSRSDRAYLEKLCAATLRYLTEFSTAQDNFLPPDNFQQQPPVGIAHRSSPTNIGLALAAVECSARMGLISQEQAAVYVSHAADTLEKLPRCKGHYYNWYDTQSLQPLQPLYISTVDSGNLYAGLLCTRRALESQGRWQLAGRLGAIMEEIDFSILYDKSRGLFHICYDTQAQHGSGGWYDLMASEAMLTSYLAISKGDVPVEHWRRLSRAQLQKDGYRGMASWTGTMFEYLMPALFLPVYRGSALYESWRFCIYAQQRWRSPGGLWGSSESAFFSLDSAFNYRYKAHGCPALALKRGQEEDLVISPYSAFLALCLAPGAAVSDLRRMEEMGALGHWGFIDALDFTLNRCHGKAQPVSCYMAHHVSMSLIAAANALCEGHAQQLFMSDPSMSAHALLLQEQLPARPVVLRRQLAKPEERPQRPIHRRWQLRGGPEDVPKPCCTLSNGAYDMLCCANGRTKASWGELCVYWASPQKGGPELSIDGETVFPADSPSLWELGEDLVRCCVSKDGLSLSQSAGPAWGEAGELRQYVISSQQQRRLDVEFSFRPVLAKPGPYLDHPAYWRLGIEAQLKGRALLLHRLPKGEEKGLWLCLMSDRKTSFSADSEGGLGGLARPMVKASLCLDLAPKKQEILSFALCLGESSEAALAGAERILEGSEQSASMLFAVGSKLGMDHEQISAAMDLVAPLWDWRLRAACPKKELWRYGISGDLPILCLPGDDPDALPLLRRFCLLKSCGLDSDLVLFTGELGEYKQPLRERVMALLSSLGLDALMDCAGGVHLAPTEARAAVQSRAVDLSFSALPPALHHPSLSRERQPGTVPVCKAYDDRFTFTVRDDLPPRAWQDVLTNGKLSFIASDCGSGNMWLANAREEAVSLPPGEIEAIQGPEHLYVEHEGRPVSLFAANDGFSCRVSFGPGWASWEKQLGEREIKTTAFVHPELPLRVMLVEGARGMMLSWGMELCLGTDDSAALELGMEDAMLWAKSGDAYIPGTVFRACSDLQGRFRYDYCPGAFSLYAAAGECCCLLCGTAGKDDMRQLLDVKRCKELLAKLKAHWLSFCRRFTLESGSEPLDRYMSLWGAYQCYACRILARGSLYQRGGAIGFRDQLQDCIGLLYHEPKLAREQILLCCRHQYQEGDVMHWWHPHPSGDKGVRTRCSDDLLWLCWALTEYVSATGDLELCREPVPFITSPPLGERERDRYEQPVQSSECAPVIIHCTRALERCIGRGLGQHGLPLIGSGDWNDALSDLEGESLWLAWFFSHCAGETAKLMKRLGMGSYERYQKGARQLGTAADAAWTGSWYVRAYHADGEPLGGAAQLDSIAQSWAALSPYADPQRSKLALDQAIERLWDKQHRIVKLMERPYSWKDRSPGYIVGYGKGYRENGGQYTHAALWLAMAALRRGRSQEALQMLLALLPELQELQRYQGEPFVLPADVCSAPSREGLAGWTWYTGSAGWYIRCVIGELLGLRLIDGLLYVQPPQDCPLQSWSVRWLSPKGQGYEIKCDRGHIYVDGQVYLGQGLG